MRFPRYGAVALSDPQQDIKVFLESSGKRHDVTRNNVVAALRPFTLAAMLDSPPRDGRLLMRQRQSQRVLGEIDLRPSGTVEFAGRRFYLFETPSCRNYTVPALNLGVYYLRERIRLEIRQRRDPYNFRMTIPDLHSSYVFYICPRPVVLVTVAHEGASNMFPMDLIGPTDSPYFSMALRNTSPAVKLMQQSRRMALAGVPYRLKDIAYDLGKHHRVPSVDLAVLPFATKPSATFALPTMAEALRFREVQVDHFQNVGSHTLFLTRVVTDSGPQSTEPQLFHSFA